MKNEKGVTLLILVITVAIMTILAATAVNVGTDVLQTTRLENFSYELQEIQGKVDTIYEKIKLGDESYITLGSDLTDDAKTTFNAVKGFSYPTDTTDTDYYYNDSTTYRYFSSSDLETYLNLTGITQDVIINFLTREVISVNGFEYEGIVYFTNNSLN